MHVIVVYNIASKYVMKKMQHYSGCSLGDWCWTKVQFIRRFGTDGLECFSEEPSTVLVVWSVIVAQADDVLQIR